MKPLNTIIALLLVASLGGVLVYLNKHPSNTATSAAADAKTVLRVMFMAPPKISAIKPG